MDLFRERQFVDHRTDDAAETANRFCPKENLVPVETFGSFDRRRHDWMQGHARIRFFIEPTMDRFSGELCQPLMFGTNVNHQQMQERGIFTSLSKLDFLLPESFEIVMPGKLDRWAEWGRTLDINFALRIASTGPTGHL